MKQRGLTLAIRNIVWAELALSAAMAGPVFAQSQPAATAATADAASAAAAPSTPASSAAAAAPAASTATGSSTGSTATQATNGVAQMKRFEVTGSLIRSSDKTGFNQVQTVTQKDITDSGATSVADYLRSSTANSASSWGESTLGNFAPGGAGIALRGLSEKYTLVLVDGQRVAPYAFASNGTDTFFDIDTLPINMIDRIEIVKTGAVSQYGSDAIAGVVNIITKKDYQGLQLGGSIGGAQHGGNGTTNFNILGGFGDLNADRFNITVAASYARSSGILMSQRDETANEDYSSKNGGFFSQPSSFWTTASGAPQALSDCGGGSVTSAANNLQTQTAGTVCSRNAASATSLSPETERSNIKVHGDFKINDNVTAFADLWESYDTTTVYDGYAGFGSGALVPSLYYAADGSIQPFSPTVGGESLTYYFPRTQAIETTSNFYRAATGVKGSFSTEKMGDWDWQLSYGHSESEVSNAYTNQINASVLSNYLSSVTQSTFSPETMNSLPGLFGTSYDHAISTLDTVDATISTGDLFKLPAGNVGIGFGAQFQHQYENIGAGSTEYVNPITQSVDGERNVGAVYYQIDIPILRNLTFSQSGRYDHYSDFGGAFSPRFALRYQPIQMLTMYTSYDRGFRAPTLIETSEKSNLAYQTVDGENVNENTEGNPNLKPERTKNYNVGFELSPARNTDIGFDWYKIDVTNVIGEQDIAALVAANPGQSVYNVSFENLSYLHTDGFEGTFRQALPTKVGTFTLSADWAYVWHFTMPNGTVADDYAGNNGAIDTVFGASFPRWKGNTTLNWAYHKWTAALTWQFTGPYSQAIVAGSPAVGSYSQFNLTASYTGFKNWTIYAGIDNLFNRAPPYDPVWQYEDRGYYDTSLYTYIGRYAQIGATYKF